MSKVIYMLRTLCLSILFGGSIGVVFSAITMVKTAMAEKGLTAAQAAAANAPVFITYAPVAAIFAGILLVVTFVELIPKVSSATLATKLRWAFTTITCAAAITLALKVVPEMGTLLPKIAADPTAHERFTALHHISRGVVGAVILCSLAALMIPAFEVKKPETV